MTNDHPGSKPILVDSGTARITVNGSVEAIDVTWTINAPNAPPVTSRLILGLAAQYGVPAADVALRRLPNGGGLAATITAYAVTEAAKVASAVANSSSAELSALLNASVHNQSLPVVTQTNATKQIETLSKCPPGV